MSGSAWTVSFVRALRPEALGDDADSLDAVTVGLEAPVDAVRDARGLVADAWGGDVSALALTKLDRHAADGDEVTLVLVEAAIALRDAGDKLLNAQLAVFSAVAAAEAAACDVQDDGTCLPPTGAAALALAPVDPPAGYQAPFMSPPEWYWGNSPERQAAGDAAAAALAERHTTAVQAALRDCENADGLAAARLAAVEVPAPLIDDAMAALQQVTRIGALGDEDQLRLDFGGWQPSANIRATGDAAWLAMVMSPLCLAPVSVIRGGLQHEQLEHSAYLGGGVIVGPDGREYPLVIPHVVEGGESYGGDLDPGRNRIEDLDGADPGWFLVGESSGVDTLTPVGTATKVLAGLGVAAGAPVQYNYLPRQDLTNQLDLTRDGVPYLRGDADSIAGPGQPFSDPRDNPLDNPTAGRPVNNADKVGGGVEVLTNLGEAGLTVQRLENSEDHLYSVRLEENQDGRLRALLRTYEVFENPDAKQGEPPFEIRSSYGYMDAENDSVKLVPFNYRGELDGVNYKHMPIG